MGKRSFSGEFRWCWIHNAQAYTEESCLYDRYAGRRPGRAECRWTKTTIAWEVEDETSTDEVPEGLAETTTEALNDR